MSKRDVFREADLSTQRHDVDGGEVLDSTPVALPVGFTRPPTLAEQVARLVRSERLSEMAQRGGFETFEEADDFSDDEDDPSTPYEKDFDLATVQAARSGFIEEKPLSDAQRGLIDKFKSGGFRKKKSKDSSPSSGEEEPSADGDS